MLRKTVDPRIRIPYGYRRGLPWGRCRRHVAGFGRGGHGDADHRGDSHVRVVDQVQVLPAQASQVRRAGCKVSSSWSLVERVERASFLVVNECCKSLFFFLFDGSRSIFFVQHQQRSIIYKSKRCVCFEALVGCFLFRVDAVFSFLALL